MSYSLSTSYAGSSLIDGFNFVTITDPSHGFVSYQSRDDAAALGLWDVASDVVTLRVDSTNVYSTNITGGRPSIRIESAQPVNKGLVIGDFAHMPGSVCGSWPAFWLYGPDWPNSGEVDIIEGANTALTNLISAHTAEGCTLPAASGQFTGSQSSTDCTSPGNNGNIGCGYVPPSSDTTSYGDDFNAAGGGIYAMEWTDAAIKVWHFPRTAIPVDIVSKMPDPSGWGTPEAVFGGSTCDVDTYFSNMSIVLNMDLCGDYAGNVWGVSDNCATSTGSATCVDWVAAHPEALANVFWEINSIDVYEKPVTTSSSILPSSTSSRLYANSSTTSGSLTSTASSRVTGSASLTSTAPTVSGTGVTDRDPLTVGDFTLLGCFGSDSSFATFNPSGTDEAMTVERCVGLCSSSRYAGVFDTRCFCADSIDAGTSALPDQDQCNNPCPGNTADYCGGLVSVSTSGAGGANDTSSASGASRLLRRAAPANVLLTVYANTGALPAPPPAPGMGGGSGAEPTTTVTATSFITLATTVTYQIVCPTNPALLETHTYATVLVVEDCGCAHQTTPDVSLSTVVQTCDACGTAGESSVTLTVPAALAPATTPVAVATGAAAGTGAIAVPVATVTGTTGTPIVVAGAPAIGKEIASVFAAGMFVLGLALLL